VATPRAVTKLRPIGVAALACLSYLLASQLGVILRGGSPLTEVRTLFWHDQLSYMAISANVDAGESALVEPFTVTGLSHYPMGYYSLVGLCAKLAGIPVPTAWNVVGLTAQLLAVAIVALATAWFAKRWLLGLLAPLPFLVGTYSFILGGSWYTQLQHHAVLWGPFGALFAKNGESAGLAVGTVALVGCTWAWLTFARSGLRAAVAILCGAAIGLIASFQTYSFIAGSYFAAFLTAAVAVATAKHWRRWLAASAFLLVTVLVAGPSVNLALGQLPTLVFGLLPALPGLGRAVWRTRGLVAAVGLAACAGAAPQVLFTVNGILAKDPFLLYRVASNHDLGVVYLVTVAASLPIAVPLLAAAGVALVRRRPEIAALSLGSVVCWAHLALNDVWGANAEPYRLWIDGAVLAAVMALVSWSLLLAPIPTSPAPSTVSASVAGTQRRWLWFSVAFVLLSLPDWLLYSADPGAQATWRPSSSRDDAIAGLAGQSKADGGGLILTDRCVDPRTTKVASGAAVAYYNDGLAWPERKAAIDELLTVSRPTGTLTAQALQTAKIGWVITDSHCGFAAGSGTALLDEVAREHYVFTAADVVDAAHPGLPDGQPLAGEVVLWRVTG
jgi:hypothetical protein